MSRKTDSWADDRNEPLSRDAHLLMHALNRYDRDDSLHPDSGSWITWITEISDPETRPRIDRETVVLRH